MSEEKRDLAFYQAHPEKYKIGSNGSIYDLEAGRFCDMISELNPYSITKENAVTMLERRRQIGQIAQLRGLARGTGMELDNATLEEIAKGAGDAIENMTAHFYQVFMKSNNVRGLAEAFRGLTAPLVGEPQEQKTVLNFHEIELNKNTMQLLQFMREAISPESVDGQVVE